MLLYVCSQNVPVLHEAEANVIWGGYDRAGANSARWLQADAPKKPQQLTVPFNAQIARSGISCTGAIQIPPPITLTISPGSTMQLGRGTTLAVNGPMMIGGSFILIGTIMIPKGAVLTESAASATQAQRPPREVSSIDGVLESISDRGRLHFNLEEHGTGKRIRYLLPEHLFEKAKTALGHRVVIEGVAYFTVQGEPSLLTKITDLWLRPDETRRLEDLRGTAPDFTEGQTAEEYVHDIRGHRNGGHNRG